MTNDSKENPRSRMKKLLNGEEPSPLSRLPHAEKRDNPPSEYPQHSPKKLHGSSESRAKTYNLFDALVKFITVLGITLTFGLGLGEHFVSYKLTQGLNYWTIATLVVLGVTAISLAIVIALGPPRTKRVDRSAFPTKSPSIPQAKAVNSTSELTPLIKPEFAMQSLVLDRNTPSHPPPDIDRFNVRYITIPVDVRALEELNLNSIPLNYELFEKLAALNSAYVKQERHTEPNKSQSRSKRILIPSFPIYGYASAGPNGEALFLNPEEFQHAEIIDETLLTEFEGMKYKVNFIDSPSLVFASNKRYGWFEVTGMSMNRAGILENDYVLFRENRNLDSNAGKIVVALLPDLDSQPPRLMVKRLVKLSGATPSRLGGFEIEFVKFLLHSESSLDYDPITGINYKKDIEIENDYQLIGDVIAIAKPILNY